MCAQSLSRVQFFVAPWTVACQTPLSIGFSRQEYWSRYPFPSPGHLPYPGIKPRSPTLQADYLPSEPSGKPRKVQRCCSVYPLMGKQDLTPRLLLTFSLVLHPLPSLIKNCWNLPIGTQRRSWRLNEGCFLLIKEMGDTKVLSPVAPWGPAWYYVPSSQLISGLK